MWLVFIVLNVLILYRFSKYNEKVIAIIMWILLALMMAVNINTPYDITAYVRKIANITEENPLMGALLIFINNSFVALMIRILGPIYAGLMIFNTAQAARHLCQCYPLKILFMPHTILELYSYSLAMKGKLREALMYLAVAAVLEVLAVKL